MIIDSGQFLADMAAIMTPYTQALQTLSTIVNKQVVHLKYLTEQQTALIDGQHEMRANLQTLTGMVIKISHVPANGNAPVPPKGAA